MNKNRSKQLAIWSLVSIAGTALVLGVNAFNGRASKEAVGDSSKATTMPDTRIALPTTPLTRAQAANVVVERVALHPYGFEPDEITRPAGPFLLAIDNQAGTADFRFELTTESLQLVHRDSIKRGRAQMQKMLNLAPGKYVLVEANHPKWTCTLTITP